MAATSMKEIREKLNDELKKEAELTSQMLVVRGRIELLRSLLGEPVQAEPVEKTRMVRSGNKAIVLSLLQEVGGSGLNAALIVEQAKKRGIDLVRGSVSSLLSRLASDGVVEFLDGKYRLKSNAKIDPETTEDNLPETETTKNFGRPGAAIFQHPASKMTS